MKRLWFILMLSAVLLLWGCQALESEHTTAITVALEEIPGCTVIDNGRIIEPGEDVVFELCMDEGIMFSSVDYSGEYYLDIRNGRYLLYLLDVQYPTRVRMNLTTHYRTIVYHSNGGEGDFVTRNYDMSFHVRPNTSIGTDLFSRRGYTLVGWNTEPDGSGVPVGLGSRVSVKPLEPLNLYAQWKPWSDSSDFTYLPGMYITITGYHGSDEIVVVPEEINGREVRMIASGAFRNCPAGHVILPKSIHVVEDRAFQNCALRELTLFDNIEAIGSGSFVDCAEFRMLHVNAVEKPFGYRYRRESCLADKVDLLIEAKEDQKIVFYGGCSMWYNLDGRMVQDALGDSYRVINAGVNGVMNSAVQMQIITAYLGEGDIFFHTPELSSQTQLLTVTTFGKHDDKLWCGLEYNYDMLSLVDLRDFPGLLDSFNQWLNFKQAFGSYDDHYVDGAGRSFYDPYGGIPFARDQQEGPLEDEVFLDPLYIQGASMAQLEAYYQRIAAQGARVYVSYACVNMDAVPPEQRENTRIMDELFRQAIDEMEYAVLISDIQDYLYHNEDFYDTNYHLLSVSARENTKKWLRDLFVQMEADGLLQGK